MGIVLKDKTIGGYVTTRNCVELNYPIESTIRSLLPFCDEIIIGDSSDKEDGTRELLNSLSREEPRIKIYHKTVNWDAPNYGVFDGEMKAYTRSKCSSDFLVQMDADEVFEDSAKDKMANFLEKTQYLSDVPLAAMPIVEYWGGESKIRVDVNPWKWRISRNDPNITHGIPANMRWYKDGLLYARPGTDGCDYINKTNGQLVQCIHFINHKVNLTRNAAITNEKSLEAYEKWFQHVVNILPTVHHFSWWNIGEKIRKFRSFWNNSWLTLYGEKHDKPEGWNPFFADKTLTDVSEQEIDNLGRELAEKTGGHIFHSPWDGKKTNAAKLSLTIPGPATDWARLNKQ